MDGVEVSGKEKETNVERNEKGEISVGSNLRNEEI